MADSRAADLEGAESETPDNRVPETDGLKTEKNNKGRGTRAMYHRYSRWYYAKEILVSYRWPIVVLILAASAALAYFGVPEITVPDWTKGAVLYAGISALLSAPVAWILLRRWETPKGVEVLDLDPSTGSHRHLRVGLDLWEELEVRSPWGGKASIEDLSRVDINGRQGYELMDLRVRDDGTPVATATWMGEASSAALRTYRYTLVYARRRLSKQAEKAQILEANREHIIREIAEKQVYQLIQTAEESGLPDGASIDQTVDDVLKDLGVEDRLLDEDIDEDRSDLDELEKIKEWTPEQENGQNGHSNGQNGHSNGHDELRHYIEQ